MPRTKDVSIHMVSDLYPESLAGLCKLFRRVLGDDVQSKCWFGTFYRWFVEDVDSLGNGKAGRSSPDGLRRDGLRQRPCRAEPGFSRRRRGIRPFCRSGLDLFKELSYTCAKLWEIKRHESPDRMDEPLPIRLWGVPVRIGSCESGHLWAKDKLSDSFYISHANQLAEMRHFMSMVAERGGENMVDWLYENSFTYDPEPVLEEMRAALIQADIGDRPKDCVPCRSKNVAMETLYLIGSPLTLSKDYY